MNEIEMELSRLPLTHVADTVYAQRPFIHVDRTAEFHVLIYILQGGMSVVEDTQEYVLAQNDLLLLKQGVHHYGVHPSQPDTRWIYVHFSLPQPSQSVPPFQMYASHLQEQEFLPGDYVYRLPLPKVVHVEPDSRVADSLMRLVTIFHSSNPLRAGYMNPLLYEILLDCHMQSAGETDSPEAGKIWAIIHYLEQHTHQPFDSEGLCREFHLSYKHLCKIFKRSTGRSLHAYHTEVRINEAARLLRETEASIAAISARMGYEDSLYFSHVFKRLYNLSPSNYRKQFMRNRGEQMPCKKSIKV